MELNVGEMVQEVEEPEWILDRTGTGGVLYWRRESAETKTRVKFRVDVEVKEFQRGAHELEDAQCFHNPPTSAFGMGLTCIICIAVTVMLPWYIIGAN